RSPRGADGNPTGFDLQIAGMDPVLVAAGAPPMAAAPWRLAGAVGIDRIEAGLSGEEAEASGRSFELALDLKTTKPAALHDNDGFVDFANAGSSYYYSRTRLAATGTITVDGEPIQVEGIAWFDHQWGDFVSVGGGGWNWFAINLEDGTDITISEILDEHAVEVRIYATVVGPDGRTTHVDPNEGLGVGSNTFGGWTSTRSGRTWSTQWFVAVGGYQLNLGAVIPDQELDTRATTGVVYYEGAFTVGGTLGGVLDDESGELVGATDVSGDAYVE
ncbi:MAG: lipocalin family protein, partial [Chloroflexota bacterium]